MQLKLNVKRCLILLSVLLIFFNSNSQSEMKALYLIPGQGSDYRIFKHFEFENYDTVHIKYTVPDKNVCMNEYARELSKQIDTSERFSIIGVSLGGMLAVEMSEFMDPEEVIIISSAKNRNELPFRYKFMKKIPLNKMFGGSFLNSVAPLAQIIVEPDSRFERKLCKSMLKGKDEFFMKHSVDMIINWDRTDNKSKIIHIHGNNDHTIPIKNIKGNAVVIEAGSHMMTLIKGPEICKLIQTIIE